MSELYFQLTAPNGKTYIQPTGLFVNNIWVPSATGQQITSINPKDETEIVSVHAASAEDVDRAVKAARTAFEKSSWSDQNPTQRGQLLKLAALVEDNAQILATIETWDNGKPFKSALGDVQEAIDVIDAGVEKFAYTVRQPLGVCGQIIPWNYPLSMAAWKIAPAITCRNTIVLEPAEQTPLSALFFANLIKDVGFPPGVINIINDYGREADAALASHLGVDKIAFTGSTSTGREIMKLASINLKNITLETGGKSPLIVFEDADLKNAVKWSHIGIMANIGKHWSDLYRNVKIGDPFDPATYHGPQVSKAQYDRILSYVRSAKEQGATLVHGGGPKQVLPSGKGFFIEPTIFTDVTKSMCVYREEVFGPLVVLVKFKTEAEAIRMANDTGYGLGAAVFTRDLVRAHRIARKIESGTVWVNSSQDSHIRIPFGGVK